MEIYVHSFLNTLSRPLLSLGTRSLFPENKTAVVLTRRRNGGGNPASGSSIRLMRTARRHPGAAPKRRWARPVAAPFGAQASGAHRRHGQAAACPWGSSGAPAGGPHGGGASQANRRTRTHHRLWRRRQDRGIFFITANDRFILMYCSCRCSCRWIRRKGGEEAMRSRDYGTPWPPWLEQNRTWLQGLELRQISMNPTDLHFFTLEDRFFHPYAWWSPEMDASPSAPRRRRGIPPSWLPSAEAPTPTANPPWPHQRRHQ